MYRDETIQVLKKEFKEMRESLGFKATFRTLDSIFFIEDFVLQHGFVSKQLGRMLSVRIVETYNGWVGQLHNWLVPNPNSMITMSEHNQFNEDEKKLMFEIINEFVALSARNHVIGLNKDKQMQAEFFDDAVAVWRKNKRKLLSLVNKIDEYWVNESNKKT